MKRLRALLAATVLFAAIGVQAAAAPAKAERTLLVFSSVSTDGSALRDAGLVLTKTVLNGAALDTVDTAHYAAGLTAGYARVIVLGGSLPETFLRDLAAFPGRVLWLGDGMQAYLQRAGGAAFAGRAEGVDTLRFQFRRAQSLSLGAPSTRETYTPPAGAQICATYMQGGKSAGAAAFLSAKLGWFGPMDTITDDAVLCALNDVLAQFLGCAVVSPGAYVSLDYIYPVSDYNKLCDMAQFLAQQGMPFTFTVMPFYVNADIGEADEYGRMLRYLVSCGGTPVLHLPVFQAATATDAPTWAEVSQKLQAALKNYAGLGIYPQAVELPENDLLHPGFDALFQSFSDVFLVSGDGKDVYTVSSGTMDAEPARALTGYAGAQNASPELRAPSSQKDAESFYKTLELLSADGYANYHVSFPSWMDISLFRSLAGGLSKRLVQVVSFAPGTHTVSLGDVHITVTDNVATYNGKLVVQTGDSVASGGSSQSASGSGSAAPGRVTRTLQKGNIYIIVFSCASMIVLIIAYFIGRRKNKGKFIVRK